MRVLHVYSGNLFGGIESMLLACADVPAGLSGVDHEFALCFDERLATELRARDRAVHLLGPVRVSRPGTAHAARQALDAVVRRQRPDRVICHAPWTHAIFGGVIRRRNVPLAFWAHDRMTGRHWSERLARHVVPDLVICNSAYTEGTKAAVYRSVPSVVVHPPVAPVRPGRERRYVRMSLDVPGDAIVVAQASRCEAWKGHTLLFDALARLRDVPGWSWWVIGGPQRRGEAAFLAALRAEVERSSIRDRVRWLGQRADVRTLLAAADVHCQPNLEPEPFGIAFVEALAAGLPVVSTDHGGVREIVDPSCGVLVPPGDAQALAGALRTLIEDPLMRRRLSRAAPDRAHELCDPLTQVRRLARALDAMGPLEMAG